MGSSEIDELIKKCFALMTERNADVFEALSVEEIMSLHEYVEYIESQLSSEQCKLYGAELLTIKTLLLARANMSEFGRLA